MLLSKILASLPAGSFVVDGPVDREIKALTHDSRLVGPGALFAALASVTPSREGEERQGGARFVLEAVEKGAVAVITTSDIKVPRATMVRVADPRSALAAVAA